ncbi:MAG: hypothetical protein NZ988_04490 [Thaumarchaeota archaeon]|nr:hypothetical protein [Candidatus Calditenuaceae archaeon]MDW8187286.1 hypothetical protein [Nitrososphaerota archaeon]
MTNQEDWRSKRGLVLASLLQGPLTSSEITNLTGLERSEVEAILLSLAATRMVEEREMKGLLRKKTVYSLTELGRQEAEAAKRELERVATEIRRRAEIGDDGGLQGLLTQYQLLVPMLLNLHLIDLMLLQGLGYALAGDQGLDFGEGGEEGGDDVDYEF